MRTGVLIMAVLTLASSTWASSSTEQRQLLAAVGPGHTIQLTRNGRKVSRLPVGRYTIVVRDRSTRDNFHLFAAGGNASVRKTGIRWVGRTTWRVQLARGTYRYSSDRKPLIGGVFKVA